MRTTVRKKFEVSNRMFTPPTDFERNRRRLLLSVDTVNEDSNLRTTF